MEAPRMNIPTLTFDDPRWLLALPLALLIPLLGRLAWRRSGRQGRPTPARRTASWLRAAAVALVVLAIASPQLSAAGGGVDVAFLVDASDSVGTTTQARDFIDTAMDAAPDGSRASLAWFGRQARLDEALHEDLSINGPAPDIDGSATNLEQALRLGEGAVGGERRRRVVLLTDGRQTAGDVMSVTGDLARAGVGLDVVRLSSAVPADLLIEEVDAPSTVREGEAYDVAVTVRNTGEDPASGELVVTADGTEVDRRRIEVEPGTRTVTIGDVADTSGAIRYEARLSSAGSKVVENDTGRAAVQVDGPPKVLLMERDAGAGDELARALDAGGIGSQTLNMSDASVPPLDELLEYDSVVLVDVPAADLGVEGMLTLQRYVRDAGHGLVAVGGENSFGLGGYDSTPLEETLPVFAQITDPQRRPPLAEALVVDTSGSMTSCHCADEGAMGGGAFEEGGIDKTDISKEAIARAVDALDAQDTVGVLAFNLSNEWVIPLQKLPSEAVIDDGLARLHPDGETDIAQAVREAIASLQQTEERLRHIVLFTDGFTDRGGLIDVAQEARDAGMTLSVVATGEGPRELQKELARMADVGGGRFYPGRDLESIPNLIALEVRLAARPIITEGNFLPTITGIAPPTENLDETPPLLGYLGTTPKPAAQTLLRIGEENDPLLATWQSGLGRATAWTSDAVARWSANWLSWDGYAQFWASVVKDTFPAEDERGVLSAQATAGGVDVMVETADQLPEGTTGTVTVTGPDGEQAEVPLQRTGLTRYEASFAGEGGGASGEGVYAVTGQLSLGEDTLFAGSVTATRAYPAEYALEPVPPGLLERITAADTARLDPQAEEIFAAAGLPTGETSRALWPWLATLAVMLTIADVGLRRLRLERADWDRARRWVRQRLPSRWTRRRST